MRFSTLTHNNAPSQLLRNFAMSRPILLAFAVCSVARAQTNTSILPQSRPLILSQTQYRVRAGESIAIDAPNDSVDFLKHAKSRRIVTEEGRTPGFVFGPSKSGDQILLVAALSLKAGEYQVSISASDEAGNERTAKLNIAAEPMQSVPVSATQPPVILLDGWQLQCPVAVIGKHVRLP